MCDLTSPIFTDEAAAVAHMEADRWPNGTICPHCGADNVTKMGGATQAGMFLCNACRDKFTVRTGTIFERSHIPLHKWLLATHLMAASKKGVSAHQLHRMLGITYKSAWFMAHRIREAMRPATYPGPIGGLGKTVEVDETFVGGKTTNRKSRKVKAKRPVVALVERGGHVRSFPVAKVNSRHMNALLGKQVSKKSYLMTDDSNIYPRIGKRFRRHERVNHSIEEYVRGDAHVNNCENYFSIFKRGVNGIYHHISEKHMPMYLAEFDFRYNNRTKLGVNDGERAALALKGAVGKRLTYRQPDIAEEDIPF